MNDIIINRSNTTIEVQDFVKLTQLHMEFEWLIYEPEALFELWCLSDNNEQKTLIEHLIRNFSFINARTLALSSQKIVNQIEIIWKLKPENSWLVATCGDNKPDGSQSLIQTLKNKFGINWKESNFYNSLTIGANEISDNSNIILIDDFIGSGDTIERKLKYLKTTINNRCLKNVTVRIISLAGMEFSKNVLDDFGVEYYSVHWLKKGINELIDKSERAVAIESMEQLEKKLQKKYHGKKLPNFGYKKSEALYALESNNIPNNVFPIFWWPFYKGGSSRKTLFKRI